MEMIIVFLTGTTKRLIDKENIMKQMNMMINLATNFINLIFNFSDNTSHAIHLDCGNAIEQWIIVSIARIDFPYWVHGNQETPFISSNDCRCYSTQPNYPNLVLYGVLIHPLCCTRIADVMVLNDVWT